MNTTIKNRYEATSWQKKYDSQAPKVGDLAPDFELSDSNGENPVRLSDFRGQKPVAIIFGSFTWPPYVKGTVSLHKLFEQYHEQVQFLSIYIREAHPVDGWWLGKGPLKWMMKLGGIKAATDIYDSQTMEERRKVAGHCETALQYGINTYVDEMDDAVNRAYAAWPTRLYLIGLDGQVIYHGGLGPFDFHPAKLGKAIQEYLAKLETVIWF